MIPSNLNKRVKTRGVAPSRAIAAVRGRLADQRGQAVVELALVLPVLVLLLFGIVQFGLALNSANDETHLANEVARYASVNENPSSESLQNWAKGQADSKALSPQEVCIEFPNGATVGAPVLVRVKGKLSPTINWLPVLGEKEIEGKAVMRLEAIPTISGPACQ
jgi:Flp pilus assembly protein TadG